MFMFVPMSMLRRTVPSAVDEMVGGVDTQKEKKTTSANSRAARLRSAFNSLKPQSNLPIREGSTSNFWGRMTFPINRTNAAFRNPFKKHKTQEDVPNTEPNFKDVYIERNSLQEYRPELAITRMESSQQTQEMQNAEKYLEKIIRDLMADSWTVGVVRGEDSEKEKARVIGEFKKNIAKSCSTRDEKRKLLKGGNHDYPDWLGNFIEEECEELQYLEV